MYTNNEEQQILWQMRGCTSDSQKQAEDLINMVLETFNGSQVVSRAYNDTDPFDPEVHTDDFF
tara:strand:- start:409 stop:597 length:189 start_codon:yes stop_codon:yes gene_type:complete